MMPQVETWPRIPGAIRDHLIERMRGAPLTLSSPAHSDVKTTMIYTHVLNGGPAGVGSPFDGP